MCSKLIASSKIVFTSFNILVFSRFFGTTTPL
jgi:hypothetical protein